MLARFRITPSSTACPCSACLNPGDSQRHCRNLRDNVHAAPSLPLLFSIYPGSKLAAISLGVSSTLLSRTLDASHRVFPTLLVLD